VERPQSTLREVGARTSRYDMTRILISISTTINREDMLPSLAKRLLHHG